MNPKGFTVLELLISTALLAFIIGTMTVAMMQQQRQFNLTKETVDIDQTGRSILDFITTEIRNAAARQGKNFSLDFINGGGLECNLDTADSGTTDSPPDCLTIFTWDITRGMNDPFTDPDPNVVRLPSVASSVTINNRTSGSITFDLPDLWFDEGEFIGETDSNPTILLGIRSRSNLCNPNDTIQCGLTPELCTECAIVIEGQVNDAAKTITLDSIDNLKFTNFPVEFNSFSDFLNGVNTLGNPCSPGDGSVCYGLINTITSQASEMTVATSKAFRVDPDNRELQMSVDGGDFLPIAGGQEQTAQGLESPGIADLQFVFNVQNPDGTISKVGICDGTTCNDSGKKIYSDFTQTDVDGREQDIRSVEVFLVVKSKTKPNKLSGGFYDEQIPPIADVLERDTDTNQSAFNEPEEGFIYRIYSTTIYTRNMAREDFG